MSIQVVQVIEICLNHRGLPYLLPIITQLDWNYDSTFTDLQMIGMKLGDP